MKKMIFCFIAISSLFMASCDDYAKRREGTIMVGDKPYKYITGQIDGSEFRLLVPADSSVRIIPEQVTYQSGKTTQTVIFIK